LLGVLLLGVDPRLVFAGVIVFQFLRYVVFENAFSPIYQMFFVAIPAERRGRAKTFLEGIIKPAALLFTGSFLTTLGQHEGVVLSLVLVCAAGLLYLVFAVRKSYIGELVPRFSAHETTASIVAEIGSKSDSKIVSLVEDYAVSPDADLRSLAVRILAHQATRQSLKRLQLMFGDERVPAVREAIARSLGSFYWYEAKAFLDQLLRDESYRVRANALFSLTEVNARWKWEFRDAVRAMLFESNLRVQIEAARLLWSSGDEREKQSTRALLASLLSSKNANKRSAGLYLVGVLQPDDWELILSANLAASSPQVFTKSIESILRYGSEPSRQSALEMVDTLARDRIAITGRAAQAIGVSVAPTLGVFLTKQRSRRMTFEVVHALRVIRYAPGSKGAQLPIDQRAEKNILRWILRELGAVYRDAVVWQRLHGSGEGSRSSSGMVMLELALRERVLRAAEWALDVMVLLDREGLITWGRRDLDMGEYGHRLDMIEILESLGSHRVGALAVPLLKFESWENIARSGRSFLRISVKPAQGGLAHFAHSENRWVCLCALYALYQAQPLADLVREERELLQRLASDASPYVSAAARSLQAKDSLGELAVETFQLLETVLFLKQTALFRNIPGERLMGLAEICEQKSYAQGTVISREGEVSDHLYLIRSGAVHISKTAGGQARVLATIGPGETYGEVGLFSQAQRSASAVAAGECQLYEVQRSLLKRLLMNTPELAFNFLEVFSEKLRKGGEEAVSREMRQGECVGREAVAAATNT
jgi:hypothetical protein